MSWFAEGTTAKAIIDALKDALDFILKRSDIIDITGLTTSQIHSALYRLKNRGLIIGNAQDPDVPYGHWRLRKLFRKIRHTIRIVETHSAHAKREWDCDCEATSEGFVPYTGLPVPPEIPEDFTTERYASVLTPKLKTEMLLVLARQDPPIILMEGYVSVEPTCSPRLVAKPPEFCIIGTQWLDELAAGEADLTHQVEVIFQNNLGELYPPGPGLWDSSFQVSENEF